MKLFCFTFAQIEKRILWKKRFTKTKLFWKTVKPFLSGKKASREQTTLTENDKIISEDIDVAQSLNSFFSSIVTNLKIPEYTDNNSNSENITGQIIKIILKYRNHPSILTMEKYTKKD